MSGSGDLVGVLSLEDFEFRSGLRQAANETKTFASQVTSAGSNMGAGFGRAVSQIGFAVQDFSSVLSMGGKNALGRAMMSTMNNVQMLGAAFGPWGLAVTAVGGAIGSVLLPKLLEGTNAFDQIAESTDAATKSLSAYIQQGQQMLSFQKALGETKGTADRTKLKEDLELQRKQKDFEIQATAGQLAAIDKQKSGLERTRDEAGGPKDAFDMKEMLLHPGAAYTNFMEINPTIDRLGKQADDLRQKLHAAGTEYGGIINRLEELSKLENSGDLTKGQQDEFFEQNLKVYEKQLDDIDHMRLKNRSPQQKLNDEIDRIKDLAGTGLGNTAIFSGGLDSAYEDFAKSMKSHPVKLAGAAQEGSAEAISIVNRAVAGSTQNPALDQAKKQVDLAKQQLDELKRLNQNKQNVVPVNLGA